MTCNLRHPVGLDFTNKGVRRNPETHAFRGFEVGSHHSEGTGTYTYRLWLRPQLGRQGTRSRRLVMVTETKRRALVPSRLNTNGTHTYLFSPHVLVFRDFHLPPSMGLCHSVRTSHSTHERVTALMNDSRH